MRLERYFVGIVLCAGYGTRLRPFTNQVPKPLVPLLNRTPLWHQIMLLKKAGIKEIYVNIHFLPFTVIKYIKENFPDVKYIFEPKILGTGGGIYNIINRFNITKHIIAVNGDTVSTIDLKKMISFYNKLNCDALMSLFEDEDIPYENSIFANRDLQIKYIKQKPYSFKGLKKYRFLGVHILNRSVFKYLPSNGCINEITYPRLIENNYRVYGYLAEKDSFDIGTPESLYKVNMQLLNKRVSSPVFTLRNIGQIIDANGNVFGKDVKIYSSKVYNSIIGDKVFIKDSEIIDSLIFPDTKITNEKIKRCVANNQFKYII